MRAKKNLAAGLCLGGMLILAGAAAAQSSGPDVTVFDLMGETKYAFSRTFDFQMYVWAAVLYLIIVELLRNVWNVLDKRLTRHLIR